jgi:hypothetical protein
MEEKVAAIPARAAHADFIDFTFPLLKSRGRLVEKYCNAT